MNKVVDKLTYLRYSKNPTIMDEAQKKAGVPWSTSRKEEKKNKHRTHKARRQQGKQEVAS